jgi:hypothetical protein
MSVPFSLNLELLCPTESSAMKETMFLLSNMVTSQGLMGNEHLMVAPLAEDLHF